VGERTRYAPGTFSWADLSTPDPPAAKTFYCQLFGWEATDNPIGDGTVYTMMSIDGKDVVAVSPQPKRQREAGAPPAWSSYITVQSADDALARAEQLGASVHAPAFDVFDAGRMGVVQDPQGAFFPVWEPKGHIGAGLVNAPGALSWNDLASPDPDASARFYGELFAWTVEPVDGSEPPYWTIKTADGRLGGGMREVMPPGSPAYWVVYFAVEDADAALARVLELDGAHVWGPDEAGPGRVVVVRDPQGAVLALYAGPLDP
jgi:predicted enzyme related to lactoylglutathione lyase